MLVRGVKIVVDDCDDDVDGNDDNVHGCHVAFCCFI